MKEKDSNFYLRAMGLAPDPEPERSLYEMMLGLDPPPASLPVPAPFTRRISLADLMRGAPAEPVVPFGEFGAPPLGPYSSLGDLVRLPMPAVPLSDLGTSGYSPFSSLGDLSSALPLPGYRGMRDLIGPPIAGAKSNPYAPAMAVPKPSPKPEGIRFNRPNGAIVEFSEPHRFSWSIVLPVAGIYVVLVPDENGKPRKFRELYFGQASNLSERPTKSHERYDDWVRAAGSAESLYVAYALMWGSEEIDRTEIESGLIAYYNPPCNDTYNLVRRALGF